MTSTTSSLRSGATTTASTASIVNKTPLAAKTNRIIGGVAPVRYLAAIEKGARIPAGELNDLLRTHLVDPDALRAGDFDSYFTSRRDALVKLVENALGKAVQRDIAEGHPEESADHFDAADAAVVPDEEPAYEDIDE